jgi:hypothetical protein
MEPHPTGKMGRGQYLRNMTLAVVAGQVGCLTLVIVLLAVFGGLWLDARFGTKPLYTLILLIGSIPVSLGIMFVVVRAAVAKIKTQSTRMNISESQEEGLGKHPGKTP